MRKTMLAGSMRIPPRCRRVAALAGLSASLLTSAVPAQSAQQQHCDIGGVAVSPAQKAGMQGRSGLMRCMENGEVIREQDVQNGRFVGAVRYFSRGQISREQFLNERGNLQGRSREFGPGGRLLREGNYDNGAFAGLVRTFHPDGSLQRASFFGPEGELAYAEFTRQGELRSLRCGERPVLAPAVDDTRLCGFSPKLSQVSFVAESGALRARASFSNGRRTRYETFQDNGLPATQEEISPAGRIERIFGADGARRREVLWSVGDGPSQREREQEFSSAGTLTRERRWSQGELVSEQTFYLNGQPRSKARYAGAGSHRILETQDFYESGIASGQGSYVDTGRYAPTPVGTHRQFDPQGRIKTETVYDTRGRLLRERNWDGSGNLLRDDEVQEDGSRRAVTR